MTAPAILWTAAAAAAATGGTSTNDWAANGVAIDSRALTEGDLFVALTGPNFDGHDFVVDALATGAAAAMVRKTPPKLAKDAPLLKVKDTFAALGALAGAARRAGVGREDEGADSLSRRPAGRRQDLPRQVDRACDRTRLRAGEPGRRS